MNALAQATIRGQRRMDAYADAMQSGTHGVVTLELGVGQIARMQEAAAALGLNLIIVEPHENSREKVWESIRDADVILLNGALTQRLLPGKIFAKSLLEGHLFGKVLERRPTIFIRTSRPEAFLGLPLHD